jgi:hypothetical protein
VKHVTGKFCTCAIAASNSMACGRSGTTLTAPRWDVTTTGVGPRYTTPAQPHTFVNARRRTSGSGCCVSLPTRARCDISQAHRTSRSMPLRCGWQLGRLLVSARGDATAAGVEADAEADDGPADVKDEAGDSPTAVFGARADTWCVAMLAS